MALTASEEVLTRQLLDQQAELLSLAANESTITSKLGSTKATLSDLPSASIVNDADVFLVRQGTTDKKATGEIVKAGLQSFTQAGTGAVTTSVQEKLRESVSVFDFMTPAQIADVQSGAGTLDVTAAIQGAVDVAKAVFFPAGSYKISASIKPRTNQKWQGIKGQTLIRIETVLGFGGINCVEWNKGATPTDPALENFHAEGITFDANGHECPAQINGLKDCSFTDCVFTGGQSYGFASQARPGWTNALDQKRVQFTRCGFVANGFSGLPDTYDGIDVKYGEDWTLTDCWAYDNADVGFNFRGKNIQLVNCVSSGGVRGFLIQSAEAAGYQSSVQIINAIAEGASSAGVTVQSNTTNSTSALIANSTATGGTLAGFEVDGSGSSRVTVVGCFSSNNSMGLRLNEASPLSVHVTACVFHGNVYGIRNYGSNLTLSNSTITGNSSYGYAEETGANNNLLLAGNRIFGNAINFARTGTATAQAVGLSVINDGVLRAFPGYSAGLEFKRDSVSGAFAETSVVGDAASIDYRVNTKGNGQIQGYKDNGARPLFVFRAAGSASVNYPDFIASLSGSPVLFQVTGSDANIDLQLNPKGSSGRVRFGAHAVSTDTAVTGYIEVKDAGGTVRRLAVIG